MLNSSKKPRPKKLLAAVVAIFALLASACSSAASEAETTSADESATSTDVSGTDLPTDAERIISLDPSTTEILFALGAGDKVIAADGFSNYPAEAPADEGLSAFNTDVEKVLSLEPDLVLTGFAEESLVGALETNKISYNVQTTPSSMEEVYAYVADLGVITGQVDEAAALNKDLRDAVAEAKTQVEAGDAVGTKVYYEVAAGDNAGYYVGHDGTFSGDLLTLVGLENIASADAMDEGNLLNPEIILTSDPALILVNAPAEDTTKVAEISERDAWGEVAAVKNKNIVAIDEDTSSRYGPRLVEFIESVTEAAVAVSVAS